MTQHTVKSYDAELETLRAKITNMGSIAEKMFSDSIDALREHDVELAQSVIASDPKLDVLQRDIDEQCIVTIARRQPLAIDLRETVTAIRIANDIERIGDLAKNIAQRALALGKPFQIRERTVGLENMADLVRGQLRDVLNAYAAHDTIVALDAWQRDAFVDALYDSLFRELLTYMMEDTRNITPCAHVLFCAKNIERVGDHTTNVAESVYYLVTGESLPADRPKGGDMSGSSNAP